MPHDFSRLVVLVFVVVVRAVTLDLLILLSFYLIFV